MKLSALFGPRHRPSRTNRRIANVCALAKGRYQVGAGGLSPDKKEGVQ